jgi:hypothetical protein
MSELLLGALLVLTITWLVVRIRRNKAAEKAESMPKFSHTGQYHSVAIKYAEKACDAAKAMTGRRFLATAAPRLPLPECDYSKCTCTFAHYGDRRSGKERRSPFSAGSASGATGKHGAERRVRNDRRKESDRHDW